MKLNNPFELLFDQIRELHCMEAEIARTFSVLSGSVTHLRLRKLLWERALRARERRDWLSNLRITHGHTRQARVCHAIRGILAEGNKRLASVGDLYTKDLVMTGHFMRIEHEVIIAYRIASRLADRAGFSEEAGKMAAILSELEVASRPFEALEGELFRTATHAGLSRDPRITRPRRLRTNQAMKSKSSAILR